MKIHNPSETCPICQNSLEFCFKLAGEQCGSGVYQKFAANITHESTSLKSITTMNSSPNEKNLQYVDNGVFIQSLVVVYCPACSYISCRDLPKDVIEGKNTILLELYTLRIYKSKKPYRVAFVLVLLIVIFAGGFIGKNRINNLEEEIISKISMVDDLEKEVTKWKDYSSSLKEQIELPKTQIKTPKEQWVPTTNKAKHMHTMTLQEFADRGGDAELNKALKGTLYSDDDAESTKILRDIDNIKSGPNNSLSEDTTTWTIGSPLSEVLRIQGTPIEVRDYSSFVIYVFGSPGSRVTIKDGRVSSYDNSYRNLKVR
jgi:hypothetical protein